MTPYPEAEAERIHAAYFERWKFCGCGDPEAVAELVRDVLAAIEQRWEASQAEPEVWGPASQSAYEECERALQALIPNKVLTEFVLYSLDAWGYLEHGSNIGGAWLTEEGEQILAALSTPHAIELALHPEFTPTKNRIDPDPQDPSWKVDI